MYKALAKELYLAIKVSRNYYYFRIILLLFTSWERSQFEKIKHAFNGVSRDV